MTNLKLRNDNYLQTVISKNEKKIYDFFILLCKLQVFLLHT